MPKLLCTAAPGFETFLRRELEGACIDTVQTGSGYCHSGSNGEQLVRRLHERGLCFARLVLDAPETMRPGPAAEIARQIGDYFCASIRNERIDSPWPFYIETIGNHSIAPERRDAIAAGVIGRLKKAISRVAGLAQPTAQLPVGVHRGLFILIAESGDYFVARQCWSGGQRRMKMVPGAPSRSYLKIEEAYGIFMKRPASGQKVVDLGAAPGGWSFSAASLGASVTAVDNGPLKEGAADNPRIRHLRADAFTFSPPAAGKKTWLFCDMVEDPVRIIALVRKWLTNGWCSDFIVNLKFGRGDPIALLDRVVDKRHGLATLCEKIYIRHLYHDREEFTVMGEAKVRGFNLNK
jgi:23S rRNA (cytidine2498-2'-O)-methyltransferase